MRSETSGAKNLSGLLDARGLVDHDTPLRFPGRARPRKPGRTSKRAFLFSEVGLTKPRPKSVSAHTLRSHLLLDQSDNGMVRLKCAHSAQAHHGTVPRLAAQPPLVRPGDLDLGTDNPARSPRRRRRTLTSVRPGRLRC